MSIDIHNSIENCYHQLMNDRQVTDWFVTKYLDWQKENRSISSMAEFARYLDVGDKALNTWVNGRNNPSYRKAIQIAKKLDDYSLLDILGYPRPVSSDVPFDSLPADLRDRLRAALGEIEETLKTRSIQPDSPEGSAISESVLRKFGFTVSSIEKG